MKKSVWDLINEKIYEDRHSAVGMATRYGLEGLGGGGGDFSHPS